MQINAKELLSLLSLLEMGVDSKGQLESSGCYVFSKDRVFTYREEIVCSYDMPSGCSLNGAIPAAPLLKVLKNAGDSEIDMSMDGNQLVIKSENGKSTIFCNAETPTDFLDDFEEPETWNPITEEFIAAVKMVVSCASKTSDRIITRCVHLHPEWIECCDNVQACRYGIGTGFDQPVLVFAQTLYDVLSLPVVKECSLTEHWLHFRDGVGNRHSCRRVLGKFFDLTELFAIRGEKVRAPSELLSVIEWCAIFASDGGGNLVRIKRDADRIIVAGKGTSGMHRKVIRTKSPYDGDPLSFAISVPVLKSAFSISDRWMFAPGKLIIITPQFSYFTVTAEEE